MRIFSNFDTKLRERRFKEYEAKYGIGNVLCFWRSKLYRAYKFLLPLIFVIVFSILSLFFMYRWLDGEYFGYILVSVFIIDLVFFIPAVVKYIDYKMDFIIVVPPSIIMHDQTWIFKKDIVTINASSVKSVSVKKTWLLYSIFDNGDIIILTEWDVAQNGEITLRWVPRPEKRKNQMMKVIGIDEHANQNPK